MFKWNANSYLVFLVLSVSYAFAIIMLLVTSCISDLSTCEINTNIKITEVIIPLVVIFIALFCMGTVVTSIILGINTQLKKLNNQMYVLLIMLAGGISGLIPIVVWNIITSGIADIFHVSTEYIICFLSGVTVSLSLLIIQNKNSSLIKCT